MRRFRILIFSIFPSLEIVLHPRGIGVITPRPEEKRMRKWLAILLVLLGSSKAAAQELSIPSAPDAPPLANVTPEVVDESFSSWVMPERKFWKGGVELGVNGADGNSNNFNLLTALNLKYENERNAFKTDYVYNYANADGQDTVNRWLWTARHERLFPGSRWSCFIRGEAERDEFKNFDVRLASHLGCAYTAIKNDRSMLKGRLGAGGSQKIGGPDTAFRPEMNLGVDFEHKFNDRTKFSGNIDHFPSLIEADVYRIEARLAFEVLIDPAYNLVLKMGLLDTYDSEPAGRRPNDISYFTSIQWRF